MARSKKPNGDEAAPAAAEAPSESVRINSTQIKKLLSKLRGHQDNIDEQKGSMGGAVNAAVEKFNLNKKMFGWIRWLNKLSPEKLATNLDDLDQLLDVSGLNERAMSVPKLPLPTEGEAEKEPDEAAKDAKNIRRFPAPAGATAP